MRAWREAGEAELGSVTVVPVGKPNDGVNRLFLGGAGGPADRSWAALVLDAKDALEAWRRNPMARRLVNLSTAFVVGDGITITSEDDEFQEFITQFWTHPENHILSRQQEWCDEMIRSGELFPVIFTDPSGGVPWVRTVPSTEINEIRWRRGVYEDLEAELAYHQMGDVDNLDGIWWTHPRALRPGEALDFPLGDADPATMPVMLHFAVNRPVGALRGESDLGPVLPWLRRYTNWLEDRVRLNASMRAFLWIVHVPEHLKAIIEARWMGGPPQAGSVIVAEEGSERWEAVTPDLHAADAEKDGRALRWMIAAGGPGTSLLDFGEGEDSNLATGTAMKEQRQRFLRQRQNYFADMLVELTVVAYERWLGHTGGTKRAVTRDMVMVDVPDISPENNSELASAAGGIVSSMTHMANLIGASDELRMMAVRLFAKFAGEALSDEQVETLVREGAKDIERRQAMEEQRTKGTAAAEPKPGEKPAAKPASKPAGKKEDANK